MRLYQHFSNSSGTTKIAINLKWWMCIKKVGVSATGFGAIFD